MERAQLSGLLDALLDRTVLGGYSRLGYLLRSRTWLASDPAPNALRGRIILVTGASSGLGKAISSGLAELGATVLMTGRDRERGQHAVADVVAGTPTARARFAQCDVSDLAAVRDFVRALSAEHPRLDGIVHNAGALPTERTETAEGHEATLATHLLGPVLLTELLRPALRAAPDPRVVLISSGGMYTQRLVVVDPEYRHGRYRGAAAYARTKRMQVALTPLLADRWGADGITTHTMHPGWADTPGVANSLPKFHRATKRILRTPAQGADTAVWLTATAPAPRPGGFWHDRRRRPAHYLCTTRATGEQVERLWRYCRQVLELE